MLTKLFKIISLVTLIILFIYFIEGRTLSLPLKSTSLYKNIFHNAPENKTTSLKEESSVYIENLKDQANILASKILEETIPKNTLPDTKETETNPQKEVILMPKSVVYETLETNQSDTDESYRPSISPCQKTMGYTIGSFDPRFGITKEQFIDATQKAAALWGDATGKLLFSYNDQGPLRINLTYDERQARTVSMQNLALEIENSKAAAENLKINYDTNKTKYVSDQDSLKIDIDSFNTRYKAYENKVTLYNSEGGASQGEYHKMITELADLKEEASLLEKRRTHGLTLLESINAQVKKYNELIAYINDLIRKSNSLGGTTFTEGRFTPSTNTIDIYQFNSTLKLERVLTHEFGHVLGINHAKDPNSIMYTENKGDALTLTEDDLALLRTVCPQ